ncbi:MAG: glycosyltransferase family 2 protein [Sporocytophaga sp.]|nr:glycosyltransferase family 2 protein [Sporocytophaga sp.]
MPFFSVCISSFDRSETIEATLKSLSLQEFKDFEVIIVDCSSTDNTVDKILQFFNSEFYKKHPFAYQFVQKDYEPQTVEDWNEPVKLATGKYIAMLEGDDQFLPDHLAKAYKTLEENPNIGIFATGNQNGARKKQGLFHSQDYFEYLYTLKEVPPPSEAIFSRLDKNGSPYFYNDRDYIYAPEIDLYMRIALDGFDTFIASSQNVIRDVKVKSRAKWKYYADHYYILDKYRSFQKKRNDYYEVKREIDTKAYLAYVYDLLYYKTSERKSLKENLIKRYGSFNFYLNAIKGVFVAVFKGLVKRIKR